MIAKQPEEMSYKEIQDSIKELIDANIFRRHVLESIYRIMMNLL